MKFIAEEKSSMSVIIVNQCRYQYYWIVTGQQAYHLHCLCCGGVCEARGEERVEGASSPPLSNN